MTKKLTIETDFKKAVMDSLDNQTGLIWIKEDGGVLCLNYEQLERVWKETSAEPMLPKGSK